MDITVKDLLRHGIFLFIIVSVRTIDNKQSLTLFQGEFCQYENFEASCNEGQVVIMESAMYGRMAHSKCLQEKTRLNCGADVLPFVDRKCSGRRECSFKVYELRSTVPCSGDLVAYLDASYTCLSAPTSLATACDTESYISPRSGFISSFYSMRNGRGTKSCPWVIKGLPGQRVNITLINFARAPNLTQGENTAYVPHAAKKCYQLAEIREQTYKRNMTGCQEMPRELDTYLSTTETLEIRLLTKPDSNIHYLLKYEVLGCRDPVVTSGMWLQRSGDQATVFCNYTKETWSLTCKINQWRGKLGNCSTKIAESWGVRQVFESDSFPYSVLIVVAIGVALGIFLGGLLLICASRYLKRRRMQSTREGEWDPYNLEHVKSIDQQDMRSRTIDKDRTITKADNNQRVNDQRASDMSFNGYYPYGGVSSGYPSLKSSSHFYESPDFGSKSIAGD